MTGNDLIFGDSAILPHLSAEALPRAGSTEVPAVIADLLTGDVDNATRFVYLDDVGFANAAVHRELPGVDLRVRGAAAGRAVRGRLRVGEACAWSGGTGPCG